MSNTILLKRSGNAAAVPAAANLSLGELSLNYTDGVLYFKNSSNVVTIIANANTASGTQLVNGNSNVVVSNNSNVTVSSAGTANVLTISSTGTVISGTISASGTITGGNLLTTGLISTVGNLYLGTGNAGYIYGNGTYLTGISAAISVSKIENGNSNVWVQTAGGDVTVTAGGVSNVAVFSTGSMTLQGAFGTPKTITSNIIVAANINAMLIGPMVFGDGYNLTVPTTSTVYIYAP
jgi:hypothetical protein